VTLLAAQPEFPTSIQTKPVTVPEYRVVGVTTTVTDGSIETQDQFGDTLEGYAAMDRLCQDEVAPSARAATVREWQTSRTFPLPEGVEHVWLDPGPAEVMYIDYNYEFEGDWIAKTASGREIVGENYESPYGTLADGLTCRRYTSRSVSCGARPTLIVWVAHPRLAFRL
jgi:hypothetical protein